jgi:hypothetical protein
MELNRTIIEAAIVGFERQKQEIEETLAELRGQLNGKIAPVKAEPSGATEPKPRRTMSAKAKKAIREAQKKRWAAFHAAQRADKVPAEKVDVKSKEAATKKAAPKRMMSAAMKKKLAENLVKARATKSAKAKTV